MSRAEKLAEQRKSGKDSANAEVAFGDPIEDDHDIFQRWDGLLAREDKDNWRIEQRKKERRANSHVAVEKRVNALADLRERRLELAHAVRAVCLPTCMLFFLSVRLAHPRTLPRPAEACAVRRVHGLWAAEQPGLRSRPGLRRQGVPVARRRAGLWRRHAEGSQGTQDL